jgi:hypothetical protein
VDEKLELESGEFDAYIRNKWEWKNSFISSNTGYVTSYYCSGSVGCGTSKPSYGLTASYAMASPYSSYGLTGSWAVGSSYAVSASWASSSVSASYASLSALDSF